MAGKGKGHGKPSSQRFECRLESSTRWSEVVPGSRREGGEGSSPASLLVARKGGKLERKRPRAGQPKHAREAAVVWEGWAGAGSGAGEAHKGEAGYNSLMCGMCALPVGTTTGLGSWQGLEKDRETHSSARSSGGPVLVQQVWVGPSGVTAPLRTGRCSTPQLCAANQPAGFCSSRRNFPGWKRGGSLPL